MATHLLKIKPKYYAMVSIGVKSFELRKNDRDYKVGDFVKFNLVFDNGQIVETKEKYIITYVLKNVEQYGLDKDYCIFGLKKVVGNL